MTATKAPKAGERTQNPHASVEMEQVPYSYHFHTKSYSYLFRCPSCGWEKRQNTNYLGRRKMVCNGVFSGPSAALNAEVEERPSTFKVGQLVVVDSKWFGEIREVLGGFCHVEVDADGPQHENWEVNHDRIESVQ